jgi:FKBP-type peptidyl-prolyl cis-trans isomerase FklB
MIDGYTTALLHMHRGDYWRVFIPADLAYGEGGNSSGSIPGYSVVIFDLTLIDFSPVGQVMPVWSVRRR